MLLSLAAAWGRKIIMNSAKGQIHVRHTYLDRRYCMYHVLEGLLQGNPNGALLIIPLV
jgi:hypothetical protein